MEEKPTKIRHPGAQRWLGRTLLHRSTMPTHGRWSRVPTAIALDKSLSLPALRTAILIARYAGAIGCCYVSQSTLARLRGVSRQMISKSLAELSERHWITWEAMYRPNSRERTSNWYTIHYKAMPGDEANCEPHSSTE